MFKYLDIHNDIYLAFKPAISEFFDPLTIGSKIKHMKKMYPDAVKDFPPSSLSPRGKSVQVSCFVNNDHSVDRIMRRSQYGIIVYCNKYSIV